MPPFAINVNTGPRAPQVIYFQPRSRDVWSTNSSSSELENQIRNARQSDFRLASLPCTGVGTQRTDSFTGWRPRHPNNTTSSTISTNITNNTPPFTPNISMPPSTITGPEPSMPRTLISTEERADQSGWQATNRDIMFSQPLLDMDREDTQFTVGSRQWGSAGRRAERYGASEEEEEVEEVAAAVPAFRVLYPEDGEPIDLDAGEGGPGVARYPALFDIFRTPERNNAVFSNYPRGDFNCIPSSIMNLYRLITKVNSDYAFTYTLCAQLSQEGVPMDCYAYLKMMLLASIISIEPGELRPPISLCVIATDSYQCHQLMSNIGRLAPRYVAFGDQDMQSTFSGLPQRSNWRTPSPLIMAQQGVFYVGDWNRQSRANQTYLEKCIENGAVPVPQTQTLQCLEAAIWTHWLPENATNQSAFLAKLCP